MLQCMGLATVPNDLGRIGSCQQPTRLLVASFVLLAAAVGMHVLLECQGRSKGYG